VDFEHNNEHNDTIFEEIRNRIMMKIWSKIPSSLLIFFMCQMPQDG